MLKDTVSSKDVNNIKEEEKVDQVTSNEPQTDNQYASMIKDGVEVVDVKVVPKIGIPTKSKTWDKII